MTALGEGIYFVTLLAVAVVVAIAAARISLPYTVALVIAGLVLGHLHAAGEPRLTRQSLYIVFLPGVTYQTALHLDARSLAKNARTIAALALPGMMVAALLTAEGLFYLAPALGVKGLRFIDAFLFGVLISPTDPGAVVALFRSLGVPERLIILVEGESTINESTAIVLSTLVLEVLAGEPFTLGHGILELLRVVFEAAAVGVGVALVVSLLARFVVGSASRVALTAVAAYGAFLLSEILHSSGVIATVVAGLITGREKVAGAHGSADRGAVEATWDFGAFALNSIVFLLVGIQAVHFGDLLRAWKEILLAYFVVTAGRAIVVFLVAHALGRSREALPRRWPNVVAWSGLRGALSIVLAIEIPESFPWRQFIVSITYGVVVLSILVQGLTMAPLLRLSLLSRLRERVA